MARRVDVGAERLRRITIPTPNPALADWLLGKESRAIVTEVTTEIFTAYRNTLPVITGNLRRGAYMDVRLGGWGPTGSDRWFGYVGNNALSYRPQRGYLYGRFIEYGKPTRGIPGQGQLRRAAGQVAGGLAYASGIPGLEAAPSGRGSRLRDARTGRFVRNPLG